MFAGLVNVHLSAATLALADDMGKVRTLNHVFTLIAGQSGISPHEGERSEF